MAQRVTTPKANFTAGELKPSLHAREDLGAYNNGAKRIENFVVMPEGGLVRRPGTRMVLPLKDEARPGALLSFKYSRTDARILCLNAGVARVLKSGGYVLAAGVPYEFAHPWSDATLPALRFVQSADVVFVGSGTMVPKTIARLSDTNWVIADYATINGPVQPQNTDTAKTIAISAVTGVIALTANFDIFQAGHVGSLWRLDESDLSLIPYWTASETVAPGAAPDPAIAGTSYRRYKGNVYLAMAPPGYTGGGSGSLSSGANPPTQTFGTFQSQPGNYVNWLFLYAGSGYVRITGVTDARHAEATVVTNPDYGQTQLPDSILSKPTYRWFEAAWSTVRGWPTLPSFAQQRLGWFNTTGYFWISNTGNYYKFEQTTDDASSIQGQLLSLDGSIIQPRWAASSGWIVIGGAEQEPVIRGPGAFDPVTQTNVQAIVDKGQGSADHRPAIVDAGIMHVGTSRQRLNYSKIDRLVETVRVDELSSTSSHVLRGLAAGLCYQHDPHRIAWGYSQNGDFWGVTFRPDQQVVAWHRHPMPNAFVEDIAAIPSADGLQTEVWMIVRRVIAGVTRRFVEVMQPFFAAADPASPTAAGAWFLDCALSYAGAPTKVITGAVHLAGATVGVFADGTDIGDVVVGGDGSVTLDRAVSKAVIGLRIARTLETLPLDPSSQGRTTRSAIKQASHVVLDFLEAWGGEVSSAWQEDDGAWIEGEAERLFDRADIKLSPTATSLFSGRKSAPLDDAHARAITLIYRSSDAYPCQLLALVPDIELMEG